MGHHFANSLLLFPKEVAGLVVDKKVYYSLNLFLHSIVYVSFHMLLAYVEVETSVNDFHLLY